MQHASTAAHTHRFFLQRLRVPLSFVIGCAYLVGARPFLWSLIVGFPIAILGLAIRAWASGHLKKGVQLATSGPYAHTRNPLYFGSFLMAAGCAVAGGSVVIGLVLIAFFLLIYWPVMRREATQMLDRFGDEYHRWALHVPLFIPRPTPFVAVGAREFDRRQYLRHREYQAALGLAAVMLVLCFKTLASFAR